MTLQQRISAFITAVGADVKALYTRSTPSGGTTGQVLTKSGSGDYAYIWSTPNPGVSINDTTASTSTVYSSTKTTDVVNAAATAVKNELLGGASAAYDTLQEIQALMEADDTAASGMAAAIAKRVAVDQVQTFTAPERAQARSNMDAYGSVELGNPDTDLAALYVTAKA